jgi:hypothetical protein
MGDFAVPIRGAGRVTVAAFGVADAEHLVEKELARAWPEARITVVQVRREGQNRIVEEFAVDYRLTATVHVEADEARQAKGAAFRRARDRLAGTRYHLTEWDLVNPPAS